jgi:hypothetical protein
MAKALSVKRARQLERGAAAADEAVREAVFRRIDEAGERGVPAWSLAHDHTKGFGAIGAAKRDDILAELVAVGAVRVEAESSPGQAGGRAGLVCRSVAAVEREAWFRAEVKRRGLDRPRSVPVLGAVR